MVWILVLLDLGGIVVSTWGHWPSWKTITPDTTMAFLNLLQLFAQKAASWSMCSQCCLAFWWSHSAAATERDGAATRSAS